MAIKRVQNQLQDRNDMLDKCMVAVKRAHIELDETIVKDAILNKSDLF